MTCVKFRPPYRSNYRWCSMEYI